MVLMSINIDYKFRNWVSGFVLANVRHNIQEKIVPRENGTGEKRRWDALFIPAMWGHAQKLKPVWCAGHVDRTGARSNAYRILTRKFHGKCPLGEARRKMKDNISGIFGDRLLRWEMGVAELESCPMHICGIREI